LIVAKVNFASSYNPQFPDKSAKVGSKIEILKMNFAPQNSLKFVSNRKDVLRVIECAIHQMSVCMISFLRGVFLIFPWIQGAEKYISLMEFSNHSSTTLSLSHFSLANSIPRIILRISGASNKLSMTPDVLIDQSINQSHLQSVFQVCTLLFGIFCSLSREKKQFGSELSLLFFACNITSYNT